MLVFLFGNACTNIHVFGNGARSVCDCNYTQQFRYLGHIDTSPRASGRDFFERENHHARLVCVIVQRMSFIFIVYRLDPAHANCQNFGLLLSTTVTFCYFSRRPEVRRKLHTLLAICVHSDTGGVFVLFLLVQRATKYREFFVRTLCRHQKQAGLHLYVQSVIHCRRLLLHKKVVLGTRIESTPLFVPAASFH